MSASAARGTKRATRALVTGATGYVAGWIIKRLLEQGHHVQAAVRDPGRADHLSYLRELETDSPGTITFFASDLLVEGSYRDAIRDCEIVFHTASPFVLNPQDPQRDLVEPARQGTINVLHQASKTPKARFGDGGYPFPKRVLPKFAAWLFGPIVDKTITRRFVARNVNHPIEVDAGKSIEELEMVYRPLADTMADMFQQLIDAGVVAPK